ncbi:MAG: hypothetical protein LUI85_17040 [Bacteroides sp.]|nr:hypothetical protein [Bacteroides sp.]
MCKRFSIALLILASGLLSAFAQRNQDVVYLNNGNVVKGIILKRTDSVLEIKASNGETYQYPIVEIRKIDQESVDKEWGVDRTSNSTYKEYRNMDSGYWTALEMGIGNDIHLSDKNMQHVELTWTNGDRFGESLKIGIGFGARYYANNQDIRNSSIRWSFPIFADVRGNFIPQTSRMAVPYWAFDIGGAIRDGFMVSPTLGIRFGERRSCFLLGLNYIGQVMKLYGGDRHFENIVSLKLGYEF